MGPVKFRAELTDFKMIYNVLKATTFKEFALIHPLEEGLKVTIEEMKCIETSIYFPSNLFCTYYIDPGDDIKFKLNIKVLTECLHVFGDDSSPSLKLSYKGYGSPLCLVIKHSEENILVDCEIQTMDPEDFSDLSLAEECSENKITMDAQSLVEVVSEMDQNSDELQILLSPDVPHFRMSATSVGGKTVLDICEYSDIVTKFECKKTRQFSYAFGYIRNILKVMNLASKVSISTSETGLLGLQLIINVNKKQIFVEYYVMALNI
ncbi:cell cycle checkpoint protein RAD1 [Onthophagus taurus]|uniref:cell cycle checkpoint protein RAD1 n=1 Tax=Onthophagus taurus TaxID=166361 RepID=UPI000C1FFC74|nr:cell cycle checkpoint protein RAD1-like [Onthophagus taurus]XP_022911490.1 cell cycle checkpoint protein RAD1-like [Onthophagus taurus]